MKLVLSTLLLTSLLTFAACSDPKVDVGATPPVGAGSQPDSPSPVTVSDPAPLRLIFFSYRSDQIIEQAAGESDQAFAQRLAAGGHGDARNELAQQRQQASAASQQEHNLSVFYQWRDTFQNEIRKYQTMAAEWCADKDSAVSMSACQSYRQGVYIYENRLRFVNTCISQLGGQVAHTSSSDSNSTAEWEYQQRMQQTEREYREQLQHINEEEAKWNREKREQDAARSGNPYQ